MDENGMGECLQPKRIKMPQLAPDSHASRTRMHFIPSHNFASDSIGLRLSLSLVHSQRSGVIFIC